MRYLFDFAIFFILIFSAYWTYIVIRSFFYDKKPRVKSRLVRVIILMLLLICFTAVFYGSFIEPRLVKITPVGINLNATPQTEQIKIVFISDIQVGPYKRQGFAQKVVDKIIEQNPDVVLLGGDYIERREKEAKYLAPFERLAAQYPVFAVTGNHEFNQGYRSRSKYEDKSGLLRNLFAQWNIDILDNENQTLSVRDSPIAIAGIEDVWTMRADLNQAAENIGNGVFKILLAHNPDVILKDGAEKFDLILAGHTHGGQITLPLIGSLRPLPTELGRQFTYGLFELDNGGHLYITSGLGESGARARLFARPEITVINLDL